MGWFELTVPYEVDGDFAREKRAIVVVKQLRLVLNQLIQPPSCKREMQDSEEKEDFQKALGRKKGSHCFKKNDNGLKKRVVSAKLR